MLMYNHYHFITFNIHNYISKFHSPSLKVVLFVYHPRNHIQTFCSSLSIQIIPILQHGIMGAKCAPESAAYEKVMQINTVRCSDPLSEKSPANGVANLQDTRYVKLE